MLRFTLNYIPTDARKNENKHSCETAHSLRVLANNSSALFSAKKEDKKPSEQPLLSKDSHRMVKVK